MKQFLGLCISMFFSVLTVNSQDNLTEMGNLIFKAFKEGRLEKLYESRLKEEQLDSLFIWLGKDISAANYIAYKSKYKLITKRFIDSCEYYLHDNINGLFSWENAELSSISYKPTKTPGKLFDSVAPKGETTTLQLIIKSNDLDYTFLIELFLAMDDIWHIGNYIKRLNGIRTYNADD